MKGSPCLLAAIVSAALVLACGGGSETAAPRFDVGAEYAKVIAARSRLTSASKELDRAQAGPSGAAPAADVRATDLTEARTAFDTAYAQNQRVLARFLSMALNVAPERPETKEALDSFARDAVVNARYVLDRGADRTQILEALVRADRAYHVLGLGVPHDLAATLEEARRTPSVRPTRTEAPTATEVPPRANRASRPRQRRAAPPSRP